MLQRFGTSPHDCGQDVTRRTSLDPPLFVHLADAYREEGLLDDAVRICRGGLQAHPSCVSGRLVLARVLLERGAMDTAKEECERILEIESGHPEAIRLLTGILAWQKAAGEPAGWKVDPLASPTLAALYASQGDTAAAEAMYRQLGLAPGTTMKRAAAQTLLERLLALREAARRLRMAPQRPTITKRLTGS